MNWKLVAYLTVAASASFVVSRLVLSEPVSVVLLALVAAVAFIGSVLLSVLLRLRKNRTAAPLSKPFSR